MKLLIVHHHFRPGGVRRVIELATPHLVAHWPEPVRKVILVTGETPERTWLRSFAERLSGTPVKVLVQPAFGYVSELGWSGKQLQRKLSDGVLELLRVARPGESLVWAHNLGLGRNLFLARELTFLCQAAHIPLIAHHHDWWFENRWHHFAAMRERGFHKLPAVAGAVLASAPEICHGAINQADASVLKKHFPGLAGWLPNPIEPVRRPIAARVRAARLWLTEQLGDPAPVWLLPCRLLRRKNILEALLLTRWLRPEAWLVTTGGVSSTEEEPYAEALTAAAQSGGWRLRLGVLAGDERFKPSVAELLAASEAVMLTSLQEGFGLPFVETAVARRPLVARLLPNIAPDLAKFGFKFPQSYRELLVDPVLFDWRSERRRQANLFKEWKSLLPGSVASLAGVPAMLGAGEKPGPAPFSRLTLTAQLEVFAHTPARSWELCAPLNPFLERWRARAAVGQLEPSPWPRSAARQLGGRAYAQRFIGLVPGFTAGQPRANASEAAQAALIRKGLRAEYLYPLLWNSRT